MDLTSIDHLLTTTRCVRKRLDFSRKVEPTIIERCIAIAIQAPTGGNAQNFNFLVVTEADKRAAIARIARETWDAFDSGGDPLNPTLKATCVMGNTGAHSTRLGTSSNISMMFRCLSSVALSSVPVWIARPHSGAPSCPRPGR